MAPGYSNLRCLSQYVQPGTGTTRSEPDCFLLVSRHVACLVRSRLTTVAGNGTAAGGGESGPATISNHKPRVPGFKAILPLGACW